jgi:hypothetical protein
MTVCPGEISGYGKPWRCRASINDTEPELDGGETIIYEATQNYIEAELEFLTAGAAKRNEY